MESCLSILHVAGDLRRRVAAGTINAIVGSGTLITFPILLALGYPPLTANISNNIGLVPGGLSGSLGLPPRTGSMRETLRLLLPWSIGGGLAGALLLLLLPASTFDAVVPVLVTAGRRAGDHPAHAAEGHRPSDASGPTPQPRTTVAGLRA